MVRVVSGYEWQDDYDWKTEHAGSLTILIEPGTVSRWQWWVFPTGHEGPDWRFIIDGSGPLPPHCLMQSGMARSKKAAERQARTWIRNWLADCLSVVEVRDEWYQPGPPKREHMDDDRPPP